MLASGLALEDRDLRLKRPQSQIVRRDFSSKRDLRIMDLPFCGRRIRFGSLDGPSDAAEDVDLPGGVEADRIELDVRPLAGCAGAPAAAGKRGQKIGIGMNMSCEGTGIDLRQTSRAGLDLLLARLAHTRDGGHQIEIGAERPGDKAVELGIVELRPPLRQVLLTGDGHAEGRLPHRRRESPIRRGCHNVGFRVVRPDSAPGKQDRCDGSHDRSHAAASAGPPACFPGFCMIRTSGVTRNTIHMSVWKTSM